MSAWFEDFPLDRTRDDTRRAEALLTAAYKTQLEAVDVAQKIGLDISALHTTVPVRFLWKNILDDARIADRLPLLIAETLADGSAAAIHSEMAQLNAGFEAQIEAAILAQKPSLATLSKLPSTGQIVQRNGEIVPLAKQGELEQINNLTAGFADVVAFRTALMKAELRTARIEVGGKAKGTGFLVGKDLLLTNWHVVHSATGNAQAFFDYKTLVAGTTFSNGRAIDFAEDWLVAKSPFDEIPIELSTDGPPVGKWDFALIRLAEPVAIQAIGADPTAAGVDTRGHYVLSDIEYDFQAAEPILIVGHPDGRPMQLSYASPSDVAYTSHGSRVRYQTNTEGGSSGSPVFNKDWKIVALHHAAGPTQAEGKFNMQSDDFNQGIPISKIAKYLTDNLKQSLLTEIGL